VPGDGMPIILLADRQTTGGYTRVAHVIQADLSKLGQARPGDTIRFIETTVKAAQDSWIIREADLFGRIKIKKPQEESKSFGTGRVYERDSRRRFRVTVNGCAYDVEILET